eukprot:GILK01006633.1.p1 GENE.GILK01006633.1~~GILK01006633.1.p1  ORF type:complete len:203 (-),score=14.40 GILK01006633.1:222-830(-)
MKDDNCVLCASESCCPEHCCDWDGCECGDCPQCMPKERQVEDVYEDVPLTARQIDRSTMQTPDGTLFINHLDAPNPQAQSPPHHHSHDHSHHSHKAKPDIPKPPKPAPPSQPAPHPPAHPPPRPPVTPKASDDNKENQTIAKASASHKKPSIDLDVAKVIDRRDSPPQEPQSTRRSVAAGSGIFGIRALRGTSSGEFSDDES